MREEAVREEAVRDTRRGGATQEAVRDFDDARRQGRFSTGDAAQLNNEVQRAYTAAALRGRRDGRLLDPDVVRRLRALMRWLRQTLGALGFASRAAATGGGGADGAPTVGEVMRQCVVCVVCDVPRTLLMQVRRFQHSARLRGDGRAGERTLSLGWGLGMGIMCGICMFL